MKIHQVSVLLAVPESTIRSWERRHALPSITRDEAGHRRYSEDDILVLRRTRDQRALGVDLKAAVASATVAPPQTFCQRLLAATSNQDHLLIAGVLDASLSAHGLPATIDQVLLPAMREVGERWSRGQCDAPEELSVSSVVLNWLGQQTARAPGPTEERPIVLSCGPLDRHTISLDAFESLLAQQGFDCRNLGAQTPARSLRQAVERSSAQAVVLVSQLGRNRTAAVAALRAVDECGLALFYAGAAFRTVASRSKLPGWYLGGSLPQAALQVAAHLRP